MLNQEGDGVQGTEEVAQVSLGSVLPIGPDSRNAWLYPRTELESCPDFPWRKLTSHPPGQWPSLKDLDDRGGPAAPAARHSV